MDYDDYQRQFGSRLRALDGSPDPNGAVPARRDPRTGRFEVGLPRRERVIPWQWPVIGLAVAGMVVAWIVLPA